MVTIMAVCAFLWGCIQVAFTIRLGLKAQESVHNLEYRNRNVKLRKVQTPTWAQNQAYMKQMQEMGKDKGGIKVLLKCPEMLMLTEEKELMAAMPKSPLFHMVGGNFIAKKIIKNRDVIAATLKSIQEV